MATKKRLEGVLIIGQLLGLWPLSHFQISSWLLVQLNLDELLNNFSKSYPNLTLIAKRFFRQLEGLLKKSYFLKKNEKENMVKMFDYLSISVTVKVTIFVTFA